MNRLKISTRLYGLIALMSLLLIGVGFIGMYSTRASNAALKTVYEDRTVPLADLADINYLINRNRILLLDMMATALANGDKSSMQRRADETKANGAKMTQIWKGYMATTLTTEEAKLAADFERDVTTYLREGIGAAVEALLKDNIEQATTIYREKVSPMAPKVQGEFDKLAELQVTVAKEEYDSAVKQFQTNSLVSALSIALGVALAIVVGVMLVRGIGRSLNSAGRLSQAVADGDLSTRIDVEGNDELSQVLRTMQAMQEKLVHTVSRVRQGADAVSVASSEIAQGNHDLSSRTENQASALEQTAASMEELSSTVKQNADNASQANQLAKTASEVAVTGGQVVGEVVNTMRGISESSKKIADIINVIDGIAFQTNILALNAAVEAARAGEQGRGFAVVAGEVRNLAQRSAQAAKEIKELINQSVERVDQGSALVDKAGTTMQDVVAGIRRVTDLMGEISAASSEQSDGVSQIGEAVTQMDQVTQQNAALVEQMAAAASSLQNQAADLVQSVAFFKLGSGDGAPRHVPAPAPVAAHMAAPVSAPRPLAKAAPRPALKTAAKTASPARAPLRTAAAGLPHRAAAPAPAPAAKSGAGAGASDDWESF